MAGDPVLKDLAARKQLLVVESEVYRQTLRLDAQNLRLYTLRMQQKLAAYAALKPLVLAGLPIASALFTRKREEEAAQQPRSLLSMVMTGWRMYQRLQPAIASLMANYMAQKEAAAAASGDAETSQTSADPASEPSVDEPSTVGDPVGEQTTRE